MAPLGNGANADRGQQLAAILECWLGDELWWPLSIVLAWIEAPTARAFAEMCADHGNPPIDRLYSPDPAILRSAKDLWRRLELGQLGERPVRGARSGGESHFPTPDELAALRLMKAVDAGEPYAAEFVAWPNGHEQHFRARARKGGMALTNLRFRRPAVLGVSAWRKPDHDGAGVPRWRTVEQLTQSAEPAHSPYAWATRLAASIESGSFSYPDTLTIHGVEVTGPALRRHTLEALLETTEAERNSAWWSSESTDAIDRLRLALMTELRGLDNASQLATVSPETQVKTPGAAEPHSRELKRLGKMQKAKKVIQEHAGTLRECPSRKEALNFLTPKLSGISLDTIGDALVQEGFRWGRGRPPGS